MGSVDIESIVRSWVLSGTSHLEPGATIEEIEQATRILGRQIPEDFVSLYSRCNGGYILGGNLNLYPLADDELSFVSASDVLRRYGGPIPPEVIVFADDGQGNLFGLWFPKEGIGRPLIVEIGEIFEEDCMAIIGTSFTAFLRGWSAYHMLLLEMPDEAPKTLDVPQRFMRKRGTWLNDEDYETLMCWANPGLPDLPISPYEARLTANDVWHLSKMLR
nr:SMI1/KNR4 family protein [Ardenticatena sp.]